MTDLVKVRGYLEVTLRVPHDLTVDRSELNEWITEDGGPDWDGDTDELLEFIKAGDSTEWQRGWPEADPFVHDVVLAELVEVEVLSDGGAS